MSSEPTEDTLPPEMSSVPQNPGYKSTLLGFLKQLASATGDLSPAIMLNGISLTEYSRHWADHPDILISTSAPGDPKVRWFVSTLFGSYASRWTKGNNEKKPYNPILGEQFLCSWEDDECGKTVLACEQVCHHPPISAFYFQNKKHQVYLAGHNGQKTKFTGTAIKVEQAGKSILYLKKHKEEYCLSYPELHIRGLLNASLFLELTGNTKIESSTGYGAKIEFIPKPWFSGEYHVIKGTIYKDNEKNVIASISGKWTQKIFITEDGKERVLFDADASPLVLPTLKPLSEQSEVESRKIWNAVSKALEEGDFSKATKEKTDIEEKQRALRKERAEKNIEWKPTLFRKVEEEELMKHGVGAMFEENVCRDFTETGSSKSLAKKGSSTLWIPTERIN